MQRCKHTQLTASRVAKKVKKKQKTKQQQKNQKTGSASCLTVPKSQARHVGWHWSEKNCPGNPVYSIISRSTFFCFLICRDSNSYLSKHHSSMSGRETFHLIQDDLVSIGWSQQQAALEHGCREGLLLVRPEQRILSEIITSDIHGTTGLLLHKKGSRMTWSANCEVFQGLLVKSMMLLGRWGGESRREEVW